MQRETVETTKYNWWRVDKKEIDPKSIPALEEHAEARIAEMREDGCTSGDLIRADADNEPVYRGYWEYNKC